MIALRTQGVGKWAIFSDGSRATTILPSISSTSSSIVSTSPSTMSVDDYSFVRHPPRHRLSESACERAHELGVPMRWVCHSSLY
jgi:hypothetical protein